MNNFTKVGIFLRPSTPHLREYFFELKSQFEANGCEVFIDQSSAGMIGVVGTSFDELCNKSELLVSVGGDGTLISLARRSHSYDKPILGINVGNLGFLTTVSKDGLNEFLKQFFAGDYNIEERMIMQTEIVSTAGTKSLFSFNDVVITKNIFSKMLDIEVSTGGELINSYYGDGLIISTPTGSTAYNISAGGPVVYPLTESFVLAPICPHSLTQRSLVLPADLCIEAVVPDGGAVAIIDGQETYQISGDDKIVIQKAKSSVQLIHSKQSSYFKILREKLHWGKGR